MPDRLDNGSAIMESMVLGRRNLQMSSVMINDEDEGVSSGEEEDAADKFSGFKQDESDGADELSVQQPSLVALPKP